jgi:hypothetical protein
MFHPKYEKPQQELKILNPTHIPSNTKKLKVRKRKLGRGALEENMRLCYPSNQKSTINKFGKCWEFAQIQLL